MPSFRLSKAVEGVAETLPSPLLEIWSALLSDFMGFSFVGFEFAECGWPVNLIVPTSSVS